MNHFPLAPSSSYMLDDQSKERLQNQYDQLVHAVYESVSHESGFNLFLLQLLKLKLCKTATLSIRDIESQQVIGGWFADMADDTIKHYIEHLAKQDPLAKRAVELEDIGFCSAITENQINMSDRLIQNWCKQADLADGACAVVYKDSQRIFLLTLGKSSELQHFSQQELAQFNRLIPHLRRAITLQQTMTLTKSSLSLLNTLKELKQPLAVLTPNLEISFINKSAEDWVKNCPSISIMKRHFTFSEAVTNASFYSHIALLNTFSDQDYEVSVIDENKNELAKLCLTPVVDSERDSHLILLTIHDWQQDQKLTLDNVRLTFDLTKSEAKVCLDICQGLSVEDIAETSNREISTIRSHLKSLYRKTGTNRQGELVSFILLSLLNNKTD